MCAAASARQVQRPGRPLAFVHRQPTNLSIVVSRPVIHLRTTSHAIDHLAEKIVAFLGFSISMGWLHEGWAVHERMSLFGYAYDLLTGNL
jgi:hypothetical protein